MERRDTMRLTCTFLTKRLPVSYRMLFVSYIKKCLEQADKEYYHSLYFYNGRRNKKTKPFSFSVFLHNYELRDEEFIIDGDLSLNITSSDPQFLMTLYNGMVQETSLLYKGYNLQRKKIQIIQSHQPFSSTMLFRTMSPMLIVDKQKKSVEIENREIYERQLLYTANLILEQTRGYGLLEPLSFEPVLMRKIMIKEKINEFTQRTGKSHILFLGYKGDFWLKGHPNDLEDLYHLGLSMRRNSGFGMLQVLNQK